MQESQLLPEHGPARGKGDALWRSLAATDGEIVVFLDSDTEGFDDRFLRGLLGPLLAEPDGRVRRRAPSGARSSSATRPCPTAAAASPSWSRGRC